MKKSIVTVIATTIVAATIWFVQPVQPHHYELHVVQYGETMTSIVEDANRNSNINYDIREAVAIVVAESKKIDGGATSRSIKPGDKVAVPIYR